MYEKMSAFDIDASGSGGEYTGTFPLSTLVVLFVSDASYVCGTAVQAGFGWTNGAVLAIAAKYGAVLAAPNCPAIIVNATSPAGNSTTNSTATYYVGSRRSPVWRQ